MFYVPLHHFRWYIRFSYQRHQLSRKLDVVKTSQNMYSTFRKLLLRFEKNTSWLNRSEGNYMFSFSWFLNWTKWPGNKTILWCTIKIALCVRAVEIILSTPVWDLRNLVGINYLLNGSLALIQLVYWNDQGCHLTDRIEIILHKCSLAMIVIYRCISYILVPKTLSVNGKPWCFCTRWYV